MVCCERLTSILVEKRREEASLTICDMYPGMSFYPREGSHPQAIAVNDDIQGRTTRVRTEAKVLFAFRQS